MNLLTIRTHVANYFGLNPDDLNINTRRREIVIARQFYTYLAMELTVYPPSYIMKTIGRSRAVAYSGNKQLENLISIDKKYRNSIIEIKNNIFTVSN
jgi:chromosomal replication initiation ATPase DnaA